MKDTIRKIANLAKIELTDSELSEYSENTKKIMKHFEKLSEIKLEGGSIGEHHFFDELNTLRDDEVKPFENAGALLDLSPEKINDFFKVPKVIEEE